MWRTPDVTVKRAQEAARVERVLRESLAADRGEVRHAHVMDRRGVQRW